MKYFETSFQYATSMISQWRRLTRTWSLGGQGRPAARLIQVSREYRKKHSFERAEATLQRARLCSQFPTHIGLAAEYAKIATGRQDWPEAAKRWRDVIQWFPNEAPVSAYFSLSQAYRKRGDLAGAEAVLETASCRYPNDLHLAAERAKVIALRKDWPRAVRHWLKILEQFSDRAPVDIFVSLSKAYRRLGDFAAAESIIRRGLARDSSFPHLWVENAETAMGRQDWDEAIRRWHILIENFGDRTPQEVWLRISLAYRLQGDSKTASKYLRELGSANPELFLGGYGPIEHIISRSELPRDLDNVSFKICVHLHLYYTQLAEIYIEKLNAFKFGFNLLVSVPETEDQVHWRDRLARSLPNASRVLVKSVPNRGRDVMPWLCTFREEIEKHDILLHIHTKASQQDMAILWNHFLLDNVCGSHSIVSRILCLFQEDSSLGLIYPPYFNSIKNQPNWGRNQRLCADLYENLFGAPLPVDCPHYPAGSFFWARTQYLKPLLDLKLSEDDFTYEASQTDDTLAHAIERIIGTLDRHTGLTKKCVSTAPPLSLAEVASLL